MADKRSKPGNGTGRTPTYQTAYHGGDKTNPLSNLARIIVEKFDKRRVPETTIDTIPFDQIYPDGLCMIGNNFYSRMVQFYDINYQLAQNDEKQHIFGEYCQFLNYFDETIHFQFCFINQRVDMEEYKKVITIPEQDDEFNVVRREYATYLRNQLEKGNNGIVKSKYLIFGIEARDRKQAVSRLAKIESDVINKFKLLGCKCVPVNGLERLRIMHDYLNQDSLEKFAMKSFKDVAESGLTPKNFITPTSFDFRAKDYYKIGDMFATTNYLIISAPEISDERNSIKMEYRTALGRAKESDLWKNSNLYDRHLQKKAVKRKYMKNAIKEYQNAKKAKSAAVTFTTGFNPMDKVKQGAGKLWEAVKALFSSPVGKIVIVFMLVLALMMSFLGVAAPMLLLSFGGDSDFSSPQVVGTGFPAEVESWRTWVTERCKANNDASSGIDLNDYVNAILATIQQESGGISSSSGGDLMQCKESGLWDDAAMPSDWTTEQKSIDIGIRVFYAHMKTWGVDGADDYDNLQIVAQAYNYGGGFLGFMKRKNAKKWTLALSTEYSNAMAQQSGWSSYGHKEYGEWILV